MELLTLSPLITSQSIQNSNKVDFNSAEYGTISLEAMFGVLNKIFSIEKVVELLTKGRNIFNLQIPKIDKGESACITFFDPSKRDKFSTDNIIST